MNAVARLKHKAREYTKTKAPSLPDHAVVVRRYSDKTANGLTKCILDWLRFHGHQAERISNTGRVIDRRRKLQDVVGITRLVGSLEWVPGTGTKGTADVSATINGRSVKIEVKVGKDRQSPSQKRYQQKVEDAGGFYMIARRFDEFMEWYEQYIKQVSDGDKSSDCTKV